MAITTYAELKTAVSSWVHRAGLTSYLDDLVTLGESRIMREVRCSDMETAFSGTISSGVVALPTGYLSLKWAIIDDTPVVKLKRTDASTIYTNFPLRAADDIPTHIAREGTNFIFGPYPNSAYTVRGIYYKNLGPLSSSAHALFTANPDLYLFACLSETEVFTKNDPRIAVWEDKYEKIKNAVNGESVNEDYSGSGLQMRPSF